MFEQKIVIVHCIIISLVWNHSLKLIISFHEYVPSFRTYLISIDGFVPGVRNNILVYFILYSVNQCISKLDKIGIFIDMKFH